MLEDDGERKEESFLFCSLLAVFLSLTSLSSSFSLVFKLLSQNAIVVTIKIEFFLLQMSLPIMEWLYNKFFTYQTHNCSWKERQWATESGKEKKFFFWENFRYIFQEFQKLIYYKRVANLIVHEEGRFSFPQSDCMNAWMHRMQGNKEWKIFSIFFMILLEKFLYHNEEVLPSFLSDAFEMKLYISWVSFEHVSKIYYCHHWQCQPSYNELPQL